MVKQRYQRIVRPKEAPHIKIDGAAIPFDKKLMVNIYISDIGPPRPRDNHDKKNTSPGTFLCGDRHRLGNSARCQDEKIRLVAHGRVLYTFLRRISAL